MSSDDEEGATGLLARCASGFDLFVGVSSYSMIGKSSMIVSGSSYSTMGYSSMIWARESERGKGRERHRERVRTRERGREGALARERKKE